MSDRKFLKVLTKPGSAAVLRENVSAAVRQSTLMVRPQICDPIDYEAFLQKNRTLLQQDAQRELLLFPLDDFNAKHVPKQMRTSKPVPAQSKSAICSNGDNLSTPLHVRETVENFTRDWTVVNFKYDAYSGSWAELPKVNKFQENGNLVDQIYEIDDDDDESELEQRVNSLGVTKEGYILKGSAAGTDSFISVATKAFKRRWMSLRQEIDGTCVLEFHKDHKKIEPKGAICLDVCHQVVRNSKRGKLAFELKMVEGQKPYILAAETDVELESWLDVLTKAIQCKSETNSRKSIALSDGVATPPSTPKYGTLRSLETSKNPELMKYAKETDYSLAMQRKENRVNVFSVFPDLQSRRGLFVNLKHVLDSKVGPFKPNFGFRFAFSCDSVEFNLKANIEGSMSHVEPIFTSVSIFDAKRGKLTEEFRFDVNNQVVKQMLPQSGTTDELPSIEKEYTENWIMDPKSAVFSVHSASSDMFLVLRIEKVLSGSISSASEAYLKSSDNGVGKVGLKVHKFAKAACQRMGSQFRMPFAFSVRQLFRHDRTLDKSSDFGLIYRQDGNKLSDEDIMKYLADLKTLDKLRNMTVIPGKINVTISELTPDKVPRNVVSSSHLPLKPFPIPPTAPCCVEVQEYLINNPRAASPFTDFVNLLFVFPKCLKFDGQKIFPKARNVCCVVEFRDSDEENAIPLQVIYGRPGCDQQQFVTRATTAISHHQTCPDFYEEIKVLLPIVLHEKQHLLFSFYHISCSSVSNKKKENCIDAPVGYSWLPIYPAKGKLSLEEQTLPVSSHLPPGYLSYKPLGLGRGFAGPEIKWVDSGKDLFKVAFKLVSSLFPSDQSLHTFLAHVDRMLDSKGLYFAEDPSRDETLSISSSGSQRLSGGSSDAGKEVSRFVQIQHGMPKILKSLQEADQSDVIRFFPVLMTQLLRLLITTTSDDVSQNIVRVIIHILHSIHEVNKEDIVQSYVEYVFTADSLAPTTSKTTLHEELACALVSLLRSSNVEFPLTSHLLSHCWFFFRITIKSMVNHLLNSNRIKMHRHERFSNEFQDKLHTLIDLLMPHIMQNYRALPGETKVANQSLAFFLQRCFALMDRGFVFKLIKLYLDKFHSARDSVALHNYKFEFLAIISAYEHLVPLNLPVDLSKYGLSKLSSFSRELFGFEDPMAISEEFSKTHFINGVLFLEIRSALSEVYQVREMAVSVLRNLLVKHSFDERYQNKTQQARIASLYFPFISVILDNINRMYVPGCSPVPYPQSPVKPPACSDSSKTSTLTSCSSKRVSFMDSLSSDYTDSLPKLRRTSAVDGTSTPTNRDSSYLQLIAGTFPVSNVSIPAVMANGNAITLPDDGSTDTIDAGSKSSSPDPEHQNGGSRSASPAEAFGHQRSQSLPVRFDKLNSKEIRDLLVIFLWTMKHVSEDTVTLWLKQVCDYEIAQVLSLLEMSIHEFKYSGRRCVVRRKSEKAMTLPARINPTALSCVSTARSEEARSREDESLPENVFSRLLEANLATEVGLITLDILGLVTYHLKDRISENQGDNMVMKKVFSIYLSFLQLGQSETLLRHIFASLRNYVNKFSIVLFSGNPNIVGQLCLELLKCCSSRLTTVRQEAAALLYLLMRSNFDYSGNHSITRMHLQIIISISRLLGDCGINLMNNPRFQESLALINNYAASDKGMQNSKFPSLVKDLTKKTKTVLMATAAMREHENDSEMLLDLQHHLANSYAETSPALRRTWLESMAKNHVKNGNLSEAAHCFAHIAALEAEYLRSNRGDIPSARAFQKISPNIPRDEEISSSPRKNDDTFGNEEQFSEEMLLTSLEQAVDLFVQAERYEVVPEVYKIMIPLHEKAKNYELLSKIYKSVGDCYDKIIAVKKSGRRLLGSYYRVAFFGKEYFEEESGKEFIYKEPKVTSLAEISQRLKDLFGKKFGSSNVQLIMSEKEVDEKHDIDPKYAYIQITHVTPYNDLNDFDRVNNINKFMFETPFCLSDPLKARSRTCEDQCKRRTILTTTYNFPYVVKRIPVVSKSVQILSPIEVAINEMEARIEELAEVTLSDSKDIKKLQLKLQGSVSVQVNAGPAVFAKAFLSNPLKYPSAHVAKLKQLYKDFINICQVALEVNEKLIASDQHEYHQSLKSNFEELVQDLSVCINSSDANSFNGFDSDTLKSDTSSQLGKNGSLGRKSYASVEIFDFISGSSNA